MTEEEYMAELREKTTANDGASLEVIALADRAVEAFPRSSRLWCLRGDFIQLGPENCPQSLDDALNSFRRAIEIDPGFAEAWEEIGHFCYAVLDDEAGAEPCFREAARLRGQHAA
jgi:tetratricopeptide (TPR) repeat protein